MKSFSRIKNTHSGAELDLFIAEGDLNCTALFHFEEAPLLCQPNPRTAFHHGGPHRVSLKSTHHLDFALKPSYLDTVEFFERGIEQSILEIHDAPVMELLHGTDRISGYISSYTIDSSEHHQDGGASQWTVTLEIIALKLEGRTLWGSHQTAQNGVGGGEIRSIENVNMKPNSEPFGVTQSKSVAARNMKAAIKLMKEAGIPPKLRKEHIMSMERGTITIDKAENNMWGIRRYGGKAKREASWLSVSIDSDRRTTAVRREWGNKMDEIEIQRIRPGATIIKSRAASQGVGYDGGSWQYYILDPRKDIVWP